MFWLSITILLVVFVGLGLLFYVGGQLAAPQPRQLGLAPAEVKAESLSIKQAGEPDIAAWYVAAETGQQAARGSVILLHGIGSSRMEMLGRVPFLSAAGYTVLLIDLQAHGETPGEHISFGHKESRGVHAAVDYLRERLANQPVGVIGFSLGGASALLGGQPVKVEALVLESVYSSISQAVKNRLAKRLDKIKLGWASNGLALLLLWQLKPRLNISYKSLAPLEAMPDLHSPVLIMGGEADQRTLAWETEAFYAQAKQPKVLWMIDGAKHENFHEFAAGEYEEKVLAFLAHYMR